MAKIDKLINNINKARNAVNSLKGISAKISSLNYTTEIDKLKESKTKALKDLKTRNDALKKINDKSGLVSDITKSKPKERTGELIYPYHDELSNYLVFDIRPRRQGGDKGLSSTIALYIPDELISSSSVSFGTAEISPLAKAFTGVLDEFGAPGGDFAGKAVSSIKAVGNQAIQKAKNFLTGGISNIKAGVVINPNKETTLNPLDFRTFSFNYEFNPKSEKEAEVIRKIIHTFRVSMLPDSMDKTDKVTESLNLTDDEKALLNPDEDFNFFFSFPNVFDIYFDGPVGDKIDGFLPAVCTSAEVNYTGGQKFATHYDGQPVKVSLSLSFQEIRVMTRSNYEQISAYGHKGKIEKNIVSETGESILESGLRG